MGGDCHHHKGPNDYVIYALIVWLGMVIDQYDKVHQQRLTVFSASVVNVVQVGMYWNFTTSREKGLMEKMKKKAYC